MAIQMRRGNAANYDETKMLPGEFAVATDDKEVYIAFGAGDSKRILTEADAVPQTVQDIWTGNCTTSRSTQVKVVTLDNPEGFGLRNGVLIAIGFSSGNTTTNPKLNVNDTGETDICYSTNGVQYSMSEAPFCRWGPGVVIFRYSGGKWYKASADMGHIRYLVDNKADLYSPQFSGQPKTTTPADGDNSTRIANTAFVQNAISASAKSLAATDKGSGVVELSLA